jgi:hypothetical protein
MYEMRFRCSFLLNALKKCVIDQVKFMQDDYLSPIHWNSGDFKAMLMPLRTA